ncbi:hypothetical protein C8R47DRAFT_1213588 [Mycena vitilis]|nr:hypothetical protein C8R47DRAFT_1213588 [Mycena vitilis]
MQFLALILAAASAAFAQTLPSVSTFGDASCAGTALATFTGVAENAFCQATPGAISLDVTAGTAPNCGIDIFSNSDCSGADGGVISSVPVVDSCFTATEEFASVRILCITTG